MIWAKKRKEKNCLCNTRFKDVVSVPINYQLDFPGLKNLLDFPYHQMNDGGKVCGNCQMKPSKE